MLKVHEFFSVATQLAYHAATIINQVRLSPDKGQKWKGADDPVTLADIKAQTYIVAQLHKQWPNLRIVGEESTKFNEPIDLPDAVNNLYTEEQFNKSPNNTLIRTQYEIEHLCVWVDPLDGTLDFVKGDFDNVTTLIGVSYKNESLMGVISQPFCKVGEGFEFKPKIYFGHYPQKRIFYTYDSQQAIPFELLKPALPKQAVRFCTQKSRITEDKLEKIKSLGGEILQIGGSGKKTLTILEGQADLFIYLGTRMSRWDICAPEALVRAFGGHFLGLAGQQYSYDADVQPYDNQYGNLASVHPELLQEYIKKTTGFL